MGAARALREAEVVERARLLDVRARRPDDLGDRLGEDRRQDQEDDEAQSDQRHLVPAEAAPEQLERRAGGDALLAPHHLVETRVLRMQEVARARARAHAAAVRLSAAVFSWYLLRPRGLSGARSALNSPLRPNNLQGGN